MKARRVIVVGLDGLEPTIVESLLAAGELPNLARLRQAGGFARVATTYPAQTPVAWSSFATGTNPGGHGIFDFLRRDPETYLPVLALNRYEQKNRFLPPQAVNSRKGTPIWQHLTNAGVPSTVIRCPCTFPPDKLLGRMIAGVGVPDIRGGLGTSLFLSSDHATPAGDNEKVRQVRFAGDRATAHLLGPRDPRSGEDVVLPVQLELNRNARQVTVRSDGQPRELTVPEGQWSDWLKLRFSLGTLRSAQGQVRFHLESVDPEFRLYVSPVNFDPDAPLFPISSPPDYAAELASRLGSFYTTGMAEDHDGLNHGRFDEYAFLSQCELVLRERLKMMLLELDRFREGFFFCLFDTPDRLQHMLWRHREEGHPSNCGEPIDAALSSVIEDHYRTCDSLVGHALKHVDDDTLCIVLSDHGMGSYQRGVHLNSWLHQHGFLVLRNGAVPETGCPEFFHDVDWDRTKAYALGLCGIFLNRRGREANGIVAAEDAAALKREIAQGLTGLVDLERQATPIRSVVASDDVYHGAHVGDAPDLLVNFASGYRVSWPTPLGGVPPGLFEDNVKRWSADHVVDPALVPGALFMNRPFVAERPRLIDLAPTILRALGIDADTAMEGTPLL